MASTPEPLSDKQVNELTMRFYEHPDPERISALIAYTATGKAANTPGIAAFLSVIFCLYPDRADAWIAEAIRLGASSSEEALLAVSMSDHSCRNEMLKVLTDKVRHMMSTEDEWESFEEIRKDYFTDLRTLSIVAPFQLDMLWAAFFASGDITYVERIVGVLVPEESTESGNVFTTALQESAYWSLASIAAEHQPVYQLFKRTLESPDTPPTVRERLGSWMKSVTIRRN